MKYYQILLKDKFMIKQVKLDKVMLLDSIQVDLIKIYSINFVKDLEEEHKVDLKIFLIIYLEVDLIEDNLKVMILKLVQ